MSGRRIWKISAVVILMSGSRVKVVYTLSAVVDSRAGSLSVDYSLIKSGAKALFKRWTFMSTVELYGARNLENFDP